MLRRGFLVLGTAASLLGGGASAFAQADLLPSWNDGTPKKAIIDFVSRTDGLRFMALVHHTDAVREYAYDRQSHIGKLDKALDEAVQRKWTVVDMKADWNTIYPFERK